MNAEQTSKNILYIATFFTPKINSKLILQISDFVRYCFKSYLISTF